MIMEQTNFYVYAWYFKSSNEIFHIGKGTGNRYKDINHSRNKYFKNIVSKYINDIDVKILYNNLTEKDAFNIEHDLILEYRKKGQCCTNLHEGGCGGNTGNYSTVSQKLREYRSTHPLTESQKAVVKKMNDKVRGSHFTQEHRDALCLSNKHTYKYEIYFNNILVYWCYGRRLLYKYCTETFGISHGIIRQIILGTWFPKFNRHKYLANSIKIIITQNEGVSTNPDECKGVEWRLQPFEVRNNQ